MSFAARIQRDPLHLLRSLIALTLAFLALAASNAAWADPPGRVGRIANADGAVWLYDDDQGEWIQAQRNRPVTEGDRVSAERGARAEIQVGATTVRLDGGTEVEFMQLDDARVRMHLHSGSVALRTRGGDTAREFSVLTREGSYEPLRAGRYRVDAKDDGSFGAALAGSLRFEASDSVLDLQAGQRAEFWVDRGVTHYAWAKPNDDRFADWVLSEEREEDRIRERSRYVSREMTGADDLDRYGEWDRHPEFGAVWYPSTVAVGWAPYRYGHWAFIRPWGWTWVDDAPWGFAPFHYGRWVNYGGRWGWCPGTYVARPVYAPALVGWFGGSNVSIGISIGGGPAVGWVPLAPRERYVPTYQVTNIYVRNVNVTHERWLPREHTVPTGPIMYTNQGVAGGVTVVPQNVMRDRRPITSAVVVQVDPRTVSNWRAPAPRPGPAAVPVAPPTPARRGVTIVPGGALPAVPQAPGAQRNPWTRGPEGMPRVGGGNNPAAQAEGRDARGAGAPGREGRPTPPDRAQAAQVPPAAQPAPQAPQVVQTPQQIQRERQRREQDPERRVVPPAQPSAPPTARPVQPAQPVQPVQPAQQVQPPAMPPAQPGPPPHGRGAQEGRAHPQLPPPQQRAPREGRGEEGAQPRQERGGQRGEPRGEPREQQNR